MAEGTPATGNRMADLIGPFYAEDSVADLLGCTRDDLPVLAGQGRVLVVRTGDGTDLYPTFQFDSRGTVREELVPVLVSLSDLPRWSVAVWLRTPAAQLDGFTPERWLAEGRSADQVWVAAKELASRLAH